MGKSLDYQTEIKETTETLSTLIKKESDGRVRDRLRLLLLLKTQRYSSQIQAGASLGMSPRTSQRVWAAYRSGGLAGLSPQESSRGFGKLSSIQISRLLQWLDQDRISTQGQLLDWLEKEMGVRYTQPGIHFLLKRLKVKLKTGRPSNIRKDVEGEKAFKKGLQR